MKLKFTIAILLLGALISCNSNSEKKKTASSSEPGLSLGIASVPNLRDLGGYENNDGATVVHGLVYRSNMVYT